MVFKWVYGAIENMDITLFGAYGRKIPPKPVLAELARPTVGGIRNTLSSYPSHGLTPAKLARILKKADQGNVSRQVELCRKVNERLNPFGVGAHSGTRNRRASFQAALMPGHPRLESIKL